ncbi:MAG: ERF family protein [Psychroserpens sp.]|nr:ERF family protein [Psychroserpens sp.]
MSIYKKLNDARAEFHGKKLKKSGKNNFAKYEYFELADFVIPALGVFSKYGLCAFISFDADIATMHIHETEGEGEIKITSPMGSAALKGCHEVQNIGAVETYQRRYLWMAALEIVEHDALDSSEPVEPKPELLGSERAIREGLALQDSAKVRESWDELTEQEKTDIWKVFNSKDKSRIREMLAEGLKDGQE